MVDLGPERLERARANGIEVIDLRDHDDDLAEHIREMTDGRGPDSVIDAVGMEAHGSPGAKLAQQVTGLLRDTVAEKPMERAGLDRLHAFHLAIDIVPRGGTISLIGVYGGMADPIPMLTIFDKQIQLRMGQANVKRWVGDIMPRSPTATRSASRASRRTACRSTRRPRPARSSRRSRTARTPVESRAKASPRALTRRSMACDELS